MQFKSHVASVNSYPAGNTVGYDRTFTLTRDSKLANITVGYSDGYRRVFTNKGVVLINGQRHGHDYDSRQYRNEAKGLPAGPSWLFVVRKSHIKNVTFLTRCLTPIKK